MLAAAACKSLAPALLLLFLGYSGITSAVPGDVAAAAVGPAATGLCQEPVVLEPGVSSVHCISPAIRMTPGQVININLLYPNPFPADQTVAIINQTAQLIHVADKLPVTPNEVYTHHFVTVDTLMVPPPTGQGLMVRPAFSEQHRLLVPANMLESEISRTVNIHLINTLGVEDVASCIECRCPPELELKNGGGVLCCTDCPSTSLRGVIEYAMEYTTIYRVVGPEDEVVPLRLARIDAARGIGERIEYEVPMDPAGRENVVDWDFTLNELVPGEPLTAPVQALRCDGHQHAGAICLELYDRSSGAKICDSCPQLGSLPTAKGDMEFVMSMSTSNITPTYQIDPEQQLRIKARYNATVRHTGVMSIMFLYYSEEQTVKGSEVQAHTMDTNLISTGEFGMKFPSVQEHMSISCQDEFFKVWSVCPIDSSSSLREENAIVCCSMLGGLTASKCLCDEVGHAEPDMLQFITGWQQVCSTETLTKEFSAACPAMRDEEYWAWSNIYLFVSPNDLNILTTEAKYLSAGLVMMWSNCISTVLFFLLVQKALKRILKERFTSLEVHEQFIVSTHIILVTIFMLQLLPYSYLMARLLFSSQFTDILQSHYRIFFWSVSCHGMLYLVEGGFRSVVRLNSLLLLHHVLFFVMPILLFISGRVLVFKAGYVLDLFATYEFGLYASLILRRLRAPTRLVQLSLAGGVGVYAVTRVVQFIILSGLFLGTFDVEKGDKWYWITLVVTVLLVVIQNFTFIIYYGMYTRLYKTNADTARKGRYSPVAEICPPDSDSIEAGVKGNTTHITDSAKGL
ncbi:hypothetical protein WJX79_004672 [Trebouxia sp. C0005]